MAKTTRTDGNRKKRLIHGYLLIYNVINARMDSSFSERSESSFTAINERTKLAGETDDRVRPSVDVRETLPSFSSFGNYARCARFGSIASASGRYAMDGRTHV